MVDNTYTILRLRTEHCQLLSHLHRLKISHSDECPCSTSPQISTTSCSLAPRSTFWDARYAPVQWMPTGNFGDRLKHCCRPWTSLYLPNEDLAWPGTQKKNNVHTHIQLFFANLRRISRKASGTSKSRNSDESQKILISVYEGFNADVITYLAMMDLGYFFLIADHVTSHHSDIVEESLSWTAIIILL